jgi:hypothetical protein
MNASQVVDEFSRQVESAKSRGLTDVSIESLESYLSALRKHIETQAPLAAANIEFQRQANEYAYQSEHEMFRSVIDSGQAALKGSLIIGGGSVAALLAFASAAWRALTPEGLATLGLTVFLLACGVLLVGVSAGLTYFSQSYYHDGLGEPDDCKQDRIGDRLRVAACSLGVGSYVLYAWSCWNLYKVMGSFAVDSYIPVG